MRIKLVILFVVVIFSGSALRADTVATATIINNTGAGNANFGIYWIHVGGGNVAGGATYVGAHATTTISGTLPYAMTASGASHYSDLKVCVSSPIAIVYTMTFSPSTVPDGQTYDLGTYIWDGSNLTQTNTGPVYTNYVLTAVNNYTVPAKTVWKFNGATVQTLTLQPGQSASWTTPAIKVSPAPADNWTANISQTPIYPALTTGDNGQLLFTNQASQTLNTSGSGSSVTNTASGGTVTNSNGIVTYTASGGTTTTPSTNNIIWQASTGSASESTLQGGFNVLHKDLSDLLAGQSIINQSITSQTITVTNQLGQIATYTRSNNDAMWQMVGLLRTNSGTAGASNTVNVVFTNYATEGTLSNFFSAVVSTNGLSDTNDFTTDFNSFVETNAPFSFNFEPSNVVVEANVTTNVSDIESESANSGIKDGENMFLDFIASLTPADIEIDFGDPDMTYQFALGRGATKVLDFNPMHNVAVAALFGFMKTLWAWLLAVFYLGRCANDAFKVIQLMENTRGMDVAAQPITKKTYY